MAGGVRIPIEAQIDANDVKAATGAISAEINALGERIAAANRLQYNPVDPKTIDDLRTINAQFEVLKRVAPELNKRLKATGQADTSILRVDWQKLYQDPHVAMKRAQAAFEQSIGKQFSAPPPPPTPPPQPGAPPAPAPPRPKQPPPPPPTVAQHAAGAVQQTFGAGLHAIGPLGGVVSNALSAGASSAGAAGAAGGSMLARAGAGLAGGGFSFLGGLAALGIGQAISGVREAVGTAEQDGINTDTLKRQLGDLGVSFEQLRAGLNQAARNIDVTFGEAIALGREFARLSGMSRDRARDLAQEVAVSGGTARALGLDPEQANRFFAQMRASQVTANTADSRRLGLIIGETITRSGAFSRADEVLAVLGQFATSQTRGGLNSANVEGYAGMLAGLVGSRIPGLDPAGAAALLGRVNQSIAAGGGAGEAGQMFLYQHLGARNGLNPIQTRFLQEQGAFGSGAQAFGGALYRQYAERTGQQAPARALGSTETNLESAMRGLRETYRGRDDLMLDAMTRLFGLSVGQSMALSSINPAEIGGANRRAQRVSGGDLSRVNATGILSLAEIERADRAGLESRATALRGYRGSAGTPQAALTRDETERLERALREGSEEELRDILVELTMSREQERTEGSDTRRTIAGVTNAITEMAQALVPVANSIRAGVMYLAGDRGARGPREIERAQRAIERREIDTEAATAITETERTGADRLTELDGQITAAVAAARRAARANPDSPEATAAQIEVGRLRQEAERVRTETAARLDALRERRRTELESFDRDSARLQAPRPLPPTTPPAATPGAPGSPGTNAPTAGSVPQPAGTPGTNTPAAPGATPGAAPARPQPEATLRMDDETRGRVMAGLAQTDRELGMPPGTSAAQIEQESGWRTNAQSRAGAMGLAQVMPRTLEGVNRQLGRQLDPWNPEDAVTIHREVMRQTLREMGNLGDALRAYNAGPRRVREAQAGGPALAPETQAYVPAIEARRPRFEEAARTMPPPAAAPAGPAAGAPQVPPTTAPGPTAGTTPGPTAVREQNAAAARERQRIMDDESLTDEQREAALRRVSMDRFRTHTGTSPDARFRNAAPWRGPADVPTAAAPAQPPAAAPQVTPPAPTQIPAPQQRASLEPPPIRVELSGTFGLAGPDGRPAAAPVDIRRRVSVPAPWGAA